MILKNRRCVVIGGSGGIGSAVADLCLKEGASVILTYNKNASAIDEIISKKSNINRVFKLQADLSNEDDVKKLADDSYKIFNKIDSIFICIGHLTVSNFHEITLNQFQKSLNTNLLVPFLIIKYFSKKMIKSSRGGNFVVTLSTSILKPSKGLCVYECSKSALSALTKNAALSLAKHDIRVNGIILGLTMTNMTKKYITQEDSNRFPLGKIGSTQNHAEMAIFLASEKSHWTTGTLVNVDGGYSLL